MSTNIFENAKIYPTSWMQGYIRPFNDSEVQMVKSCKVVAGYYSLLLECKLCNGKRFSIPITKDSDAYIGFVPDITKAKLVEFERGEQRCIKVRIKL